MKRQTRPHLLALCLLLVLAQVVTAVATNKQKMDSQFLTAAKKGELGNTRVLLAKGANVNARNQSGNSALYLASSIGRTDLVQLLLKKGALVNQPNMNGRSSLDIAANMGHTSVVKLLLENGANPNAKDSKGFTVLMTAVSMEVMARKLAAGGYKPEQGRENIGPDPNLTIIKLLLTKGAKVDSTSLEFANDEPLIRKLLQQHRKSQQ